jgi:hypothetical protein
VVESGEFVNEDVVDEGRAELLGDPVGAPMKLHPVPDAAGLKRVVRLCLTVE